MSPEEFLDAVRDANNTALSRLGSSKSLYADTGGEMDEGPVLAAAADHHHHAAEVLEGWAADAADDDLAAAFRDLAGEEREAYETVAGRLDDHRPGDGGALYGELRALEGPLERLGGLAGRALVAGAKTGQTVGFFVGQADPGTAGTFRDLDDRLEAQAERAAELLDERCDDEDRNRAREAASAVVQAAYDEYTERLESMGVNPKPVC